MRIEEKEQMNWPYFDYEGVEFQIRFIDETEVNQMSKACTEKKGTKKEDLDYIKYNRLMAKKAIVGWRNMTRADIRKFIEPGKVLVLEPGETWADRIEYSEQMLDLIVRRMHYEFSIFIAEAARNVQVHTTAEREREMANLGAGSSGSENINSSQRSGESGSGTNTSEETDTFPNT